MQMYFNDLWWSLLLLAIGSYLIGNVNFAILISQSKNKDIRKMGSGNPGTLNMSRQFGLKFGLLTLFLDAAKGAVPALVAKLVYSGMFFGDSNLAVGEMAQYLAGFFAVLGHIFPAIYGFNGGKGIATTIGVFLVTETVTALICAVLAIAYILIKEIGSIGSFIATAPPAIAAVVRFYNDGFKNEPNFEYGITFFAVADLLVLGIILLTWLAHRKNIVRLLEGEEHQTGWMQAIRNMKIKRKAKRLEKKQTKKIFIADGDFNTSECEPVEVSPGEEDDENLRK